MQIPLFTGGRLKADEASAGADLGEARARQKLAVEIAEAETEAVLAVLDAAVATWQASAGTVEQATRAYEIADLRYREGISTQLELLDARLVLQLAQVNRAQAARDVQVARARVSLLPDLPLGGGGDRRGRLAGSSSETGFWRRHQVAMARRARRIVSGFRAVVGLALLGAASLAAACGGNGAPPPPAAGSAAGVVDRPRERRHGGPGEIRTGPLLSGELRAAREAMVRAKMPGSVLEVTVEEGQSVRRGAVIARIEARPLQDALLSSQSAVRSAEQALAVAEREAERTASLVKGGALAERDIELARTAVAGSQAQLADARARLASVRQQLEDAVVTAPISGVVSGRPVNAGDVVSPGTPIATIIDLSSMWLEASVQSEALVGAQAGDARRVPGARLSRPDLRGTHRAHRAGRRPGHPAGHDLRGRPEHPRPAGGGAVRRGPRHERAPPDGRGAGHGDRHRRTEPLGAAPARRQGRARDGAGRRPRRSDRTRGDSGGRRGGRRAPDWRRPRGDARHAGDGLRSGGPAVR